MEEAMKKRERELEENPGIWKMPILPLKSCSSAERKTKLN